MQIGLLRFWRLTRTQDRGLFRLGRPVALVCMPLLIVAAVAWIDREAELRSARQKVVATTHVLSEHVGALFLSVDLALAQVRETLGDRAPAELRSDADVHRILMGLVRRMPQLELVFVADENGGLVATSRTFPAPERDLSQREFYLAGKAGQQALLFSVPFRGQTSRSVSFAISRALWRDGVFRGVVGAIVFPEYFHASYRALLAQSSSAAMALVRKDGTLLLRSPDLRDAPETPTLVPDVREERSRHESGLLTASAVIDGDQAIVAYRAVPGTDLTMVYAVSEYDILSAWYKRATGYAVFAVASAIGVGALLRRRSGWEWLGPGPRSRRGAAGTDAQHTLDLAAVGAVDRVLTPVLADLTFAGAHARLDGQEQEGDDALSGAAHGVRLAQRLLGAGRRSTLPRIVNVPNVLNGVRRLLIGSIWPPIEIVAVDDVRGLDAFVDAARFELAILDLVMGMKRQADAGSQIHLSAQRDVVRSSEQEVEPGDYVLVAVRSILTAVPEESRSAATRIDEIAAFATRAGGGFRLARTSAGLEAKLWIPAALSRRQEAPGAS